MSERKREGSGVPKVFESKKEKKRRLILSDSESEERDTSPPPCKRAVPGAEQNGGSPLGTAGLEEERKKRAVSSDAVKQRKEVAEKRNDGEESKVDKQRVMRLEEDSKQREEAGTDRRKATWKNDGDEIIDTKGSTARLVVFKRREEGGSYKKDTKVRDYGERLKVDKQRFVNPDASQQREEARIVKKKTVDERKDEEELKADKKKTGRLDAVKEREDFSTDMKKAIERSREHKVDKKRAVSSDVVWKKEETRTDEKKLAENKNSNGDLKADKKRDMSLGIVKKREGTDSYKKRVTVKRNDNDELKIDQKSVIKSGVLKHGEEAATEKKMAAKSRSDKEELKFDQKRTVRPDSRNRSEETGTDREKSMELDSEDEDLKFYKKRPAGSHEVKERDKASSSKKTLTGLGSNHKFDRKRSREIPDAEISLKRIKTELKHGKDQTTEFVGKNMKFSSHKHGDEKAVTGSKSVAPVSNQKVGLREKNSPVKSEKNIKPEAEKVRWMERSGQRMLRKLKDNSVRSVGIKGEVSGGISQDKSIKVGRALSGGKIDLDNRSSSATQVRHLLNMKKTSSVKKHKSCEAKTELKTPSPEPKNKGVPSRISALVPKRESSSSLKAPLSAMLNTEEATVSRGAILRKIREQIKGILLDAGWKIDLRPRRGRNYEDQVYIPPTGGSGYWSITKAYTVFQEKSNHGHDDKNKNLSGKSSKKSTGTDNNLNATGSPSSVLPLELLSMLKRKVVNKRRSRSEIKETERKRSKKAKKTTKMKHLKNKTSKDSADGVRGRKRLNRLVSSSTKGSSGKSSTRQRGCALLVRHTNQEVDTEYDDYIPYIWKRTVFSWMIDLGIVPLNGKVKYMNKQQTRSMLEGQITRDGILCNCCSKILTVSKFEIHAGSKLHQPYQNIFVEDSGLPLLQCQLDAWEKQDESERRGYYSLDIEGDDPNDDTCGICGDGGDLICCDGCPSTFHQSCLGIETLPPGDWHCANCSCRFCGLVSEASAQESDVPVSSLRCCYQCEEKYHQDCIPEEDAMSASSSNSHDSFCGKSCRKVFRQLQKLLGVQNDLEAGFSWRLVRRLDEDSPLSPFVLPQRAECNAKIAVALAVMVECFLPIIDQRSGINLIHNIVYNCRSNFNRLNYSGFYTFLLERGDEVISAASIRFHGTRLAEMPFIGTRNMYRRQGMCRRLLNGIESALCSLGIKKLMIPAISELTETWTTVFGFKPLDISQQEEVKSINMLVFPGTGLLQKPMMKKDSSEPTDEAEKVEPGIVHLPPPEVADSSVRPKPHASDELIVDYEDEIKDVECNLPALDYCVPSTSNVASECFNASHASEFHAPDGKSSENAAGANIFIHSEVLCHDKPVEGDRFQVDSSAVPKIKSPYEDIMYDDHNVEIKDTGLVSNSHASEETLVLHTSENKCTAPDATVSTVRESGSRTYPNLPCVDGTLLPHNSEAYHTSSGVGVSTVSGGSDLHVPVSSLESVSDSTDHCTSDIRSISNSTLTSEHSLKASGELIQDDNHDINDRVTCLQPKLKAFGDNSEQCNSEIVTGSADLVTNKFTATSMEFSDHVVGEGTVHAIHEARTEVASVKPKPDLNDENAEPCTSADRLSSVPSRKENQASDGNDVTYICDVITRPVCTASVHGLQLSDAGTKKSSLVAPPVATENLHHNEHNLADSKDSSNNCVVKRSHEANYGSCSFGQTSCALHESSAKYHASGTVCKTPDDTLEPILPSPWAKSCKVSGASLHAEAAYPLMPDAVNNSLGMVAKDSDSVVHGGSDLCAIILSDTYNESLGNVSNTSDRCAISESAKPHSA